MQVLRRLQSSRIIKILAISLGSALLYYLAAKIGLQFATLNKQTSPVWPATGVAACLYFLFGWRAALGIFAGAVFTNFETGLHLPACFIIGIGNTAEAVIGVLIFRFLIRFKKEYGLHAPAIFVIFTIAIASSISSTIGTMTLSFFKIIGPDVEFKTWVTWWIGDIIGALFLVPFVHKFYVSQSKKNFKAETVLRMVGLALLASLFCFFVFNVLSGAAYLFIIFVPLLIAAFYFDSLWIYATSLLICSWAIAATVSGSGPFVGHVLHQNLVHLQLFLMGLGITAIGIASLKNEGLNRRVCVALIFGWVLSGLTFYSFYNSKFEIDHNRFSLKAEQAEEAIQQRLEKYIFLLESGVSLFNASEYISQDEWGAFTEKLLKNEDYSSIENLSVAFPTKILDVNYFYQSNGIQEKKTDLKFYAVAKRDDTIPVSNPETHFIITYAEPYAKKKNLIGLDLSSEKHRYDAAIRARDTGLASASGSVHLNLDTVFRPSIILFSPIYKMGEKTNNLQERRKAFVGFVLAPIIFDKFLNGAIAKFKNEVHLKVSLESEAGKSITVFESEGKPFHASEKIERTTLLAGQPITYTWQKASTFEVASSLLFSLISFLGSVVTLLLAMMLSSLQNLNARAQILAESQTKEILKRNRIWKLLTEVSPVGIFLTNKTGQCTYVNPMWGILTGKSVDFALGDGWIKAIHPDDLENISNNWNKLITGGSFDCSYRFLKPDGRTVNVWAKAVPLPGEGNEISGYLGIIQDMTDSVTKTNALLASSRMSSLGEMASGIAHEINNPLSIILGNVDLLENLLNAEDLDRLKAKTYVNQVTLTVQRIAKIIRGLRSFARETTHEPFEKCVVKDVVSDCLELCLERFKSHGIRLIIPTNLDITPTFWGRSEQIAQVLLNLLNNAFDVANDAPDMESKWVQISVKIILGKIQISVTDCGQGIEPDKLQKIFEPFYTSKKVGKGTGLGLSISKGIVELHQGKIFIDKFSKNTTFVVELNLLEEVYRKDMDLI